MAGGKIKGISKKEGGDIKKFECVSGGGNNGLFRKKNKKILTSKHEIMYNNFTKKQ